MAYLFDDTICALATATGGAMATIRVSGSQAITITDALFVSPTGHRLVDARSHTAHYGTLQGDDGEVLDDVVVTVMRGPHSYTGEDTTEVSCHGSRYIITLILHALIKKGCRQALPGEFTQRAFLNGKLDLSQAEAVADLISATNSATHKMALSQLRGNFSHELGVLRDELLRLTSLLELELDFSDHEDLEFADRSDLMAIAQSTEQRIRQLAHSFETGNALRQGIAVAIIGKTNVGKSTLLNRLLHDDKAIVSDIHGTTRDVIEDTTQIHGITFRFIDTAGIRATTAICRGGRGDSPTHGRQEGHCHSEQDRPGISALRPHHHPTPCRRPGAYSRGENKRQARHRPRCLGGCPVSCSRHPRGDAE